MLVVINKFTNAAVCAINCTVDGRNCCMHSTSHRSDSQNIRRESQFCLHHLHSTLSLEGGPRGNISVTFGVEN